MQMWLKKEELVEDINTLHLGDRIGDDKSDENPYLSSRKTTVNNWSGLQNWLHKCTLYLYRDNTQKNRYTHTRMHARMHTRTYLLIKEEIKVNHKVQCFFKIKVGNINNMLTSWVLLGSFLLGWKLLSSSKSGSRGQGRAGPGWKMRAQEAGGQTKSGENCPFMGRGSQPDGPQVESGINVGMDGNQEWEV